MSSIFVFGNFVDDLIDGHQTLGGEGAFVASALQILKETTGADTSYTLAGRLDTDTSGKFLKSALETLHVDISKIAIGGTKTCQILVEGVRNGRFIRSNGGSICAFYREEWERFREELLQPGWIFFTSNTIKDNQTWEQVQKILNKSPRIVFFDINWREHIFARGQLHREKFVEERLVPVLQRAEIIKGTAEEIQQFQYLLRDLKKSKWIIETMGRHGVCLSRNGEKIFQTAPEVEEVQDTGAGDTFSGTFLFEMTRKNVQSVDDLVLLSSVEVQQMLQLACCVASMTVQGFGVEYLEKNRGRLAGYPKVPL